MANNNKNNYNKMSKPSVSKGEKTESINETPRETDHKVQDNVETLTPKKEETLKPKLAYVDNCERLNVRTKPSKNSDVLGIIEKGMAVEINDQFSTTSFYSVTALLANGVKLTGYCMKEYITIEE